MPVIIAIVLIGLLATPSPAGQVDCADKENAEHIECGGDDTGLDGDGKGGS